MVSKTLHRGFIRLSDSLLSALSSVVETKKVTVKRHHEHRFDVRITLLDFIGCSRGIILRATRVFICLLDSRNLRFKKPISNRIRKFLTVRNHYQVFQLNFHQVVLLSWKTLNSGRHVFLLGTSGNRLLRKDRPPITFQVRFYSAILDSRVALISRNVLW